MASKPQTDERKDNRGAQPGSRKGTKWEGRMGNLPHEPTEETRLIVKTMVACGATQKVICYRIGIHDEATLLKYYADEIEFGAEEANAMVAGRLFQLCNGQLTRTNEAGQTITENVDHNVMQRSIQLWLDRRGGPEWRQRQRLSYVNEFGSSQEEIEARPDEQDVKPMTLQVKFVKPKALPIPDDEK